MPFCWDSNFPSVRGEVWLRWAPNLTLIFLWFNGPPPSPEGPSRVIHDQRPAPTPFCSAQNPGCCVFFAQRRLQVLQETCVACPDDGHSNNLLHVLAIRLPRHCILAQCATGGHQQSHQLRTPVGNKAKTAYMSNCLLVGLLAPSLSLFVLMLVSAF